MVPKFYYNLFIENQLQIILKLDANEDIASKKYFRFILQYTQYVYCEP